MLLFEIWKKYPNFARKFKKKKNFESHPIHPYLLESHPSPVCPKSQTGDESCVAHHYRRHRLAT